MKRIIFFIILLFLAILAISFTLLNSQTVQLNFYFLRTDIDLMWVVLLSVCIGAAMGVIATLGMVFRLRHELTKRKKEVKLIEKEVANLRALPLKDKH